MKLCSIDSLTWFMNGIFIRFIQLIVIAAAVVVVVTIPIFKLFYDKYFELENKSNIPCYWFIVFALLFVEPR